MLMTVLMAAARLRAAQGGSDDPYWSNVRWSIDFTPGTAIESRNGYTTTLVNGASLAPTTGLTVDQGAAGEHLKINNVAPIGVDTYVIECYFEPTDTAWAYVYLFSTMATQTGGNGTIVYVDGAGSQLAHAVGGDRLINNTTRGLAANTTHHAALTRDGSTLSFYFDGVRLWTGTNQTATTVNHSQTNHYIGGNEESAGYPRTPTVHYKAARLTVGSLRGYTGASFTPDPYPFPSQGPAFRFLKFYSPGSNAGGNAALVDMRWMVGGTDYPTANMTSGTEPAPLVVTENNGGPFYGGWRVFDGDLSLSTWFSSSPLVEAWIVLDLGAGNGIRPTGIGITPYLGYSPTSFICYGSNTGAFAGEETVLFNSGTTSSGWSSGVRRNFTF
jgi:hypothetical protein